MGSLLLKTIIRQLDQYLRSTAAPGTLDPGKTFAELGNIASSKFAGGDNDALNEKVVVSLVNISEEASLKNNRQGRPISQQHLKQHPIVHVNLYLLITALFDDYGVAVDRLFRVLEFFQGRKIFKFKNAPTPGLSAEEAEQYGDIELTVELHTLSFEQLNDLWGSLGGKQLPFVLYRVRLVPIQMELPASREGLITEIDLTTNLFN